MKGVRSSLFHGGVTAFVIMMRTSDPYRYIMLLYLEMPDILLCPTFILMFVKVIQFYTANTNVD